MKSTALKKPINIAQKFDLIDQMWVPKIVAESNNDHIKLDKFHGEFIWHKHEFEDELFLVIKGNITEVMSLKAHAGGGHPEPRANHRFQIKRRRYHHRHQSRAVHRD